MSATARPRVAVTKDGPYIVTGGVPLARLAAAPDGEGGAWQIAEGLALRQSCALCRCGRTKMAPFCDYKHMRGRFDGSEAADRTAAADGRDEGAPVSIGFVREGDGAHGGPLRLRGAIDVVSVDGFIYPTRRDTALCRCGASRAKPFCDGSHEEARALLPPGTGIASGAG